MSEDGRTAYAVAPVVAEGDDMNLYISDLIARERQSQLLADASRWRRWREAARARQAPGSDAMCPPRTAPVYCRRAAALSLKSA